MHLKVKLLLPLSFLFSFYRCCFLYSFSVLDTCFLACALTDEIHSDIVMLCVEIITQYFLVRADLRGGLGVFGAAVIRDTACFFFGAGGWVAVVLKAMRAIACFFFGAGGGLVLARSGLKRAFVRQR